MWGYRDAMTGEKIKMDSKTGRPLVKVNRHHFKISDPNNKIECWLEVLVPLIDSSHGAAHTKKWEEFFGNAVNAMRGEILIHCLNYYVLKQNGIQLTLKTIRIG